MCRSYLCGFLAAALLAPAAARAKDYTWARPSGGDWWTPEPTNWDPDTGVPMTPGDNAHLAICGGLYTVHLNVSPTINMLEVCFLAEAKLDVAGHMLTLADRLVLPGSTLRLQGAGTLLAQAGVRNDPLSSLQIGGEATLSVGGGAIENEGALRIGRGPGDLGTLDCAGEVVLVGAGSAWLDGGCIAGPGRLTNRHILAGYGDIQAAITNDVLIQAAGGTLRLSGAPMTNNGTLSADAGAVLDLGAWSIDQWAGGGIRADAGTVRLAGTWINGGYISVITTLECVGTNTIHACSVGVPGEIRVRGSTLNLAVGAVHNAGRITLEAGSSICFGSTVLEDAGRVEFLGGGRLDGEFVNSLDHTILGQSGTGEIWGGLFNRGFVSTVGAGNGIILTGVDKVNRGLLCTTFDATLSIRGIRVEQHAFPEPYGTILADKATLLLCEAAIVGGEVHVMPGARLTVEPTLPGEKTTLDNVLFRNEGLTEVQPGAHLVLTFGPFGGLTHNAGILCARPGATLTLSNPVNQGPDGDIIADGGTVRLSGCMIMDGALTSVHDGRVVLPAGEWATLVNVAIRADTVCEAGSILRMGPVFIQAFRKTTVLGTIEMDPGTLALITGGIISLGTDAGAGGRNLTIQATGDGRAEFTATQHLAGLDLADASSAVLARGSGALVTNALAFPPDALGRPTAALDLEDGNLILDYAPAGPSPLVQVAAWVRSGYNAPGGYWNGPGIRSCAAAGDPDVLTALGVLDNANGWVGGKTHLEGEPVDASSILVKYTWWGDANLDGRVNLDDYDVIDYYYWFPEMAPEKGWWVGDFDYDGDIDFDDYDKIDYGYWFQTGPLGGAGGAGDPARAAPEPAALALLAAGGILLAASRRRGRQVGSP